MTVDRLRFARHLALAELGEAGQLRLALASVALPDGALAAEVARRYARRGGVGGEERAAGTGAAEWPGTELRHPAARAVVEGSLAALEAFREAAGLLPRAER